MSSEDVEVEAMNRLKRTGPQIETRGTPRFILRVLEEHVSYYQRVFLLPGYKLNQFNVVSIKYFREETCLNGVVHKT